MATYSRNQIRIMKTALAVAIIRQKPDDVPVREYTEKLALQFVEVQGHWRHKALKLEQELLCLRQELVECQLRPQLGNAESQEMHCTSYWHDQSTVYSSNGAVGGVRDDVAMETSYGTRGRIRTHVRFLSSVSSLMHSNHHLSLVGVADLRTAVQDTVIDALKALGEVLESCDPVSSYQSLETALVAVKDTIQSPLMLPFESELLKCCEQLLRSLVKHLRCHHRGDGILSIQSALCVLSSFPPLFSKALDELVDQIECCSQMLQSSLKDVVFPDSDCIGALGTMVAALEVLLSKYNCSQLPPQTRTRLLEKLEASVLGLAAPFPLFSYAVWRLTVYFQH